MTGYDYGNKEIYAPFEFAGYTETYLFNGWFQNHLCPELPDDAVVILDNARFHHSNELHEIAENENENVTLLYLPPYSPDLNPIEKFWANIKRNIRKVIKKFNTFKTQLLMHLTKLYRVSYMLSLYLNLTQNMS